MDSILHTRLHPPVVTADAIPRPRLLQRLSPPAPLTLVCAPAGFGKSTFAARWLRQQEAVAWLSLDELDNDPLRFFPALFAALEPLQPGLTEEAAKLLCATASPSAAQIRTVLIRLVNAMEAWHQPLFLALDDLHVIDNPSLHEALNFLVTNQPPALHLVLLSRSEPPLPIATLRAKKRLAEIGAAELCFTLAECRAFLADIMELHLTEAQVRTLQQKSEGWITGLQLAALSLQAVVDVDDFLAGMSGSDRHVADYLLGEVLQRQSPQVQDLLLQCSLLKRMCAPLCDHLLQQEGSQLMLEQLETAGLFIIPLDTRRGWYRFHHFFVEMLQQRLRARESAETVRELHRRAAEWYRLRQQWDEAIEHALEAEEFDKVLAHLEANLDSIVARGDFGRYLRWMQQVPVAMLPPRLNLHRLFFLHEMGEFAACAACLHEVEAQLRALEEGGADAQELAATKGILATVKGVRHASLFQVKRAQQWYSEALELLPESSLFWQVMALTGLGFCDRVEGRHSAAVQLFSEGLILGRQAGLSFCCVMDALALGRLWLEAGKLEEAFAVCRPLAAADQELAGTATGLAFSGPVKALLGQLHYHRGDLAQAESLLRQGLEVLAAEGDAFSLVQGSLTLALTLLAQGAQAGEAQRVMAEMSTALSRQPVSTSATIIARSATALVQILTGEPRLAEQSLTPEDRHYLSARRFPALVPLKFQGIYRTAQQPLAHYTDFSRLIAARLELAEGRPHQARQQLEALIATFPAEGRALFEGEVWVLHALACGPDAEAEASLRRAVLLLAPGRYSEVFVREGAALVAPLQALLPRLQEAHAEAAEFVAEVLAQLQRRGDGSASRSVSRSGNRDGARAQKGPLAGLTPREMEVLLCMTEGGSYDEMAGQLFVSINTLKTHIKRIYSKLGVSNRTQAINIARQHLPNSEPSM